MQYGYVTVFLLAALFGAITIACVLMIPGESVGRKLDHLPIDRAEILTASHA
ncbi:hypothetical protein [Bradyrhizobium sp. CCBAU 53421]|uniref:hypothetical protein n=1 Tax=Bradyrhizobium sp. CCBAU 53421 TaxID=1325120 RepID=UPI00188DAFEF|nr:hypothetical protein [Bradyrhizobium sp. CCBAU 53421]